MDARQIYVALFAIIATAGVLLRSAHAVAEGFEMVSDPQLVQADAPPGPEMPPQSLPGPVQASYAPAGPDVAHGRLMPVLLMDSGLAQHRLEGAALPPQPLTSTVESDEPMLKLGVGDQVNLQVFGRPEFNTTTYVSDDGTINVPLVGAVEVVGKSPSGAATVVAKALKAGQFLVNPQVSLMLPAFKSQQVSVLGEVRNPGRYSLESKTTLLDLLAQAGGISETGATTVYLIRSNPEGKALRQPIDLRGLASGRGDVPDVRIKSGDSVYVPKAEQFYVYGEVQNPNMYRLESGTTVLQAISRSGGLTPRGSDSRIVIKRRGKNGKYENFSADLTDYVQADDVIRVKERIF